MTTYRQLQDEILQTLQGFGLDQSRAAFLTEAVTDTALTFNVSAADAASVQQGLAEIGGESVYIQSVNRTTGAITIAPDGRGFYGTTAAAHAANARLVIAPTWPRNRIKSAINDTLTAVYPTLFGVAQTQFAFNPSQSTYSLPTEAERVLAVTADLNGPSREQQQIRKYHFNAVAPTDDWVTTNTISLHEGVTPGKTITVTYAKAPSALSADGDQLTASGLRETAKLAIVYGACSQLVSFADVGRLPVDVAQSDEFTERNQVGMASRVAGQLYLRFQAELEAERRRLRAATPVAIVVKKR